MTDESIEPETTQPAPSDPSTSAEPAAPSAASALATANKHRPRRIVTWVAVVLAVVLFLVATAAVWAKNTVLSTDRVVKAVDAAAQDPQVIDALSSRITQEILSLVDVTVLVQSVLPSQLDPLAPIIQGAVANQIENEVNKVVSSDAGRRILESSVRVAHEQAITLLEGGGLSPDSAFSVQDGQVVLDIVPLVVAGIEALQRNGVISDRFDLAALAQNITSDKKVQALARVFGITLPDGFGQIVLLDSQAVDDASSTLAAAQRALAVFQKAVVILVIAALAMIAIAMLLSVDRRRTLAQIAIGIGVGALLMRIGIDRVVIAVSRAIDRAGAKVAAVSITESLTETLARVLVILAIVGLTVGVIAHLLRPSKDGGASWLTSLVRDHADLARVVVVGVSLALLAVAGITWISVIVVGALCVAGVLYVNGQMSSQQAEAVSTT
jgi:cell division protein FtsB